ncbi:MAG: Gluconokinase [Nitrospirae bacterium]|nr:MAG: gluconate kinase [Nitrospira sp. OLB3]MBV6471462.1 Gluconokinase [Nitrospirota bacterium]MCE7965629.1 gluconokinase [Nitrospira sp. NTP2]MCK6492157.1 gluconokinase, GntK/IdnK-type [Nitrospira sp.]MEB2339411.1 gluconokinase, GntK/IdnK-type [Nitrospirales bacterium]
MVILVMGVSGAGKTVVGRALAGNLGWTFIDGDDLHPPGNIEKMRSGQALTDEDRQPWLAKLHAAVVDVLSRGQSAVVACSILTRDYRRTVRRGVEEQVRVVYLRGSEVLFRDRLDRRTAHFMGPDLLASQLALLEEPIDALVVDAALPPERLIRLIRASLGL